MKRLTVIIAALLTIGASAFASTADCPLKNLKKSQTMAADGTAFYPQHMAQRSSDSSTTQVGVGH